MWNYAPPDGTGDKYTPPGPPGPDKRFALEFKGLAKGARAKLWRVDRDHGNVVKAYDAMGRPAFPSREQLTSLREAARLAPPVSMALSGGKLSVQVPSQGLVIVEIH